MSFRSLQPHHDGSALYVSHADPQLGDEVAVRVRIPEGYGPVTAVVVPREGVELSDDVVAQIQALVKEKKGSVQVPKQVIAAESIPLTGLGKPDKKALRANYA